MTVKNLILRSSSGSLQLFEDGRRGKSLFGILKCERQKATLAPKGEGFLALFGINKFGSTAEMFQELVISHPFPVCNVYFIKLGHKYSERRVCFKRHGLLKCG